jgi:hypothetical protein
MADDGNFAGPATPGSVSIGFGGRFMYGPFGAAADTSFGFDSQGNICVQFTTCGQVGFGLFGGLGIEGSVASTDFCEGDVSSKSWFVEGGSLFAGSGSLTDLGDGDFDAAGGLFGVGKGGAAGMSFCETRTVCMN